jgi:NDP-sugar pyrophosphorylase family protein
MKAVILAAGTGARLGEISKKIPKPMILVGGKPVLENNVKLCKNAGIKNIHINLHHLPEVISSYFGDGKKYGVNISYFYEEEIQGTAGALLPMAKYLQNSPIVIIYGDNYFDIDLNDVYQFHQNNESECTIVVHQREDVRNSGMVVFDASNKVTEFIEKPKDKIIRSNWVNAGVYIINDMTLLQKYINRQDDFGHDIIPKLLENDHHLFAYKMYQDLFAIDTPDMLEFTTAEINKKNIVN